MSNRGSISFFERYKPFQVQSVLQRRFLHVSVVAVLILILAATIEMCRVAVEWPAVTLGLLVPEPPTLWAAGPTGLILAYDTGSAFLNFALGEAVVVVTTVTLVALVYALAVFARRWAGQVGVRRTGA